MRRIGAVGFPSPSLKIRLCNDSGQGDDRQGSMMDSGEADAVLLAWLRAGDEAAYEELVRRETRHLLAVARRLLRNEEDAQDAVQQAFLSAFRALPSFNAQSRLTTWLHKIVANAALMKLRTSGRHPEERIEDLLPAFLEDGHHAERFSEWALPADLRLVRHETRARVRMAIERLPETYRSVLMLRDIEELSTEEAAEALGITATAVKVRLHRARQALLKLLTPALSSASGGSTEFLHPDRRGAPGNAPTGRGSV
jgi:RNA polymerase sigma-70 factor (ECF subfamily)